MNWGDILGSSLRKGWKTSEFWLSVVGLIGVPTVLATTDKIVQNGTTTLLTHGTVGAVSAAIIVGTYNLGRAWIKSKVGGDAIQQAPPNAIPVQPPDSSAIQRAGVSASGSSSLSR